MYQPMWVNGQEVGDSDRNCDKRYTAIRDELRDGPLRVLDFGAYSGYFSARLSEDFPQFEIVAVDSYRGLPAGLKDTRVEVVHKRLGPAEVAKLGRFDVVLCLSVLHHVPEWRSMLNVLSNTETLFIETPRASEVLPKAVSHCDELAEAVDELGGKVLCRTYGYKSKKQRALKLVTR